jgi:hypothetical protein
MFRVLVAGSLIAATEAHWETNRSRMIYRPGEQVCFLKSTLRTSSKNIVHMVSLHQPIYVMYMNIIKGFDVVGRIESATNRSEQILLIFYKIFNIDVRSITM